MITDIFARRYQHSLGYAEIYGEWFGRLFIQVGQVFFEDLEPAVGLSEEFYKTVHDQLTRELGQPVLVPGDSTTYRRRCGAFLVNRSADDFDVTPWALNRFSLVELLFREADAVVRQIETKAAAAKKRLFGRPNTPVPGEPITQRLALSNAIGELNTRLRESKSRLSYHNGLLQVEEDGLTADRTAKPFWELVSQPEWAVVDREMKDACDRLDRRQDEAVSYAMRALESTLKIICDQRGWSTGKEKGAVAYIDNLKSQRSGLFIATWEAEAITALFRHVRNPYSHGGGSNPPPPLTPVQSTWAVEACMSWIKSLIRRL